MRYDDPVCDKCGGEIEQMCHVYIPLNSTLKEAGEAVSNSEGWVDEY